MKLVPEVQRSLVGRPHLQQVEGRQVEGEAGLEQDVQVGAGTGGVFPAATATTLN